MNADQSEATSQSGTSERLRSPIQTATLRVEPFGSRFDWHLNCLARRMNAPISDRPQALVVAAEAAVRDDMVKALRTVRMEAVSTGHIDGCVAKIPNGTALVLLHPDGFRFDQVVGILFALRRERPEVRTVLMTDRPERFAKLVVAADNAPPPSIIPMPAPTWTILETAACAAAADAQRREGASREADKRACGNPSQALSAALSARRFAAKSK